METQELKSIVEALIFAADEPLSEARLRETLELENGFDFGALIEALNQEYQSSGRAFTIRKIAGGYQIVTQQNYASWIRKLYLGRQKNRLSHAALETLALIAFKQPISRVDIAQIRGVNSDGVIGTLLERKLITISGRSEAVGRPLLYSTTTEFLKYFGINDIADLPKPREIEELFSKEGMPEELLQALSQTDAQLSLPINGSGETSTTPEETENKFPTIAAPPVIEKMEPMETVAADLAMPPSAPAIPAVDINEEVVTQLEEANKFAAGLSSLTPSPASKNEIAWISLNNDTGNPVEPLTASGRAIDDLIETANDFPAFAGVAEVVAEHSAEPSMAKEAALEDFTENTHNLPAFADVAEVVSKTLAVETISADTEIEARLSSLETMTEEMTADFVRTDTVTDDRTELAPDSFVAGVAEVVAMVAESPSAEVQVVEAYGVGQNLGASPPQLEIDAAEEVDGWMAEESAQEEIAEPDFVKKSGDFFLEDERQPAIELAAAREPDVPVFLTESEPVVVETLAEQSAQITIVDFPEPTIVEANTESTPAAEFAAETQVTQHPDFEATNAPVSELQQENITVPVFQKTFITTPIKVEAADEPPAAENLESDAMRFPRPDSNFAMASDIPPAPSAANEMTAPPIMEIDDSEPATWRERVTGWIKRTFTRLLTLMGARI